MPESCIIQDLQTPVTILLITPSGGQFHLHVLILLGSIAEAQHLDLCHVRAICTHGRTSYSYLRQMCEFWLHPGPLESHLLE